MAWFAVAEAVGTWLMVTEPVVAKPATPGNSAPMRPKSAQARETRATARRKR